MYELALKERMPPQQLCDTFSKEIVTVRCGVSFILSTMVLFYLRQYHIVSAVRYTRIFIETKEKFFNILFVRYRC